jgi:PRTRC genetic system protein A
MNALDQRIETIPACITDPRDRILLSQAPPLPMPVFGTLPPTPVGRRRYVLASDGLYVQARHHGLDVTVKLKDETLPYGPLRAVLQLTGGLIPFDLFREIERLAVAASPLEWAGVVHWDERQARYRLTTPRVIARSCGEIEYATEDIDFERVVLIVHSHGLLPAFFSAQDDASDAAGVYFASVLGHCRAVNATTSCTRLVIEGRTFPVARPPWITRQEHENDCHGGQ